MKKLITALVATLALSAHAEILATITSPQGDAKIIFLSEQLDCPRETSKVVLAVAPGSIVLEGCWVLADKHFQVLWSDQSLNTYAIASAQPGPWYEKEKHKYRPAPKLKSSAEKWV